MEPASHPIEERAEQARELYASGRQAVEEFARTASDRSRQALVVTDEWVHHNSWIALGIVASLGLLVGLLISQTSRNRWD